MAIPAFVQAGSGVTVTTGSGVVELTGCTAGNLILIQCYADGTGFDFGIGTHVNIKKLDGTPSEADYIANFGVGTTVVGYQFAELGRVMANGTVSATLTVGASGDDLMGRIYEFSGAGSGTTVATVIESDTDPYAFTKGTGTSLPSQEIVTNGADRLGVQLVVTNSNQALGSFTGEAGVDWTETVAEYNGGGTLGTLQLQTGGIPTAGTVGGGGTQTITSAEWCVVGQGIIPGVSTSPTSGGDQRRGVASVS